MWQLYAGQFFGRVAQRWQYPGLIVSTLVHGSARKIPWHGHQRPYLSLVVDGDYRETTRLLRKEYRAPALVSHPADFEHCDEIGRDGARFLTVEVTDELTTCGCFEAGFDTHGGAAVWLAMRLLGEAASGGDTGSLGVEALACELVARTMSRAAALGEKSPPKWLARVDEWLEADYASPPSLQQLSADAGVHPGHLSRTYRRFRRQSIGETVRRRKVIEAARVMRIQPEIPLASLALDLGFADQSHFTRTFKTVTGMKPSAYRDIVAGCE